MANAVHLPPLSPDQKAVRKDFCRFNLISGGRKCGNTFIACDIAISAPLGAFRGGKVAYFVHDAESFAAVRQRLSRLLEPALERRPTSNRFELKTGGSILLFTLEKGVIDLIENVSMVIVDDAGKVDNFYSIWEDGLRPFIGRHGQAWIFGKPRGPKNGFGRLAREADWDDEWRFLQMPSSANPKISPAAIAKAKAEMTEDEFAQEFEGVVLDQAIELSVSQTVIGKDETFLDWCDRLAADGLKVDGLPFKLDDRPTMRWVYSLIPSTVEEAFGKRLVLMKCAQVGFTIMEMLAMIYMALKFMPCKVGMYLPDRNLAQIKSSERFMPVVRTVPVAHRMMMEDPSGVRGGKTGEGNVMVRNMGPSRFYFLWTSGKGATESVPLDVVSFDEVQEMAIADMEKTSERMSASRIRFTLMGSTANWPDRDIHFFYKKGQQFQFWTECESCGTYQILDDHFPNCIRLRDGVSIVNGKPVEKADYRYVCHECDEVIADPQRGEWRPTNPDADIISVHYPQFLSPTISPREIIEAYFNADDMKNFFNRKRGKPYLDPSQVPVNLEMLNECAELGMEMGVIWKQRATGTFMGIDQMGQFNVVLIAERLPTGHMAIIHAEEIYADEPFERCDVLMVQYGVQCCVCEALPNFNSAWSFAKRHPGKVFIAGYADISDEMLRWGDSRLNRQDLKTDEDSRVQYTVTLDQYKCMQSALSRIQKRTCVFPDPMGLVQEIREKGLQSVIPILKDRVFMHFTRTALIAEQDEEQKKFRRRVVKVGIDPHFSYAFMLLFVAFARAHGTSGFILPDSQKELTPVAAAVEKAMPGLPSAVVNMMHLTGEVCGRCVCFEDGVCSERKYLVNATDPGCPIFLESSE